MKAFGKSQSLEWISVDHLCGHLAHVAVFHKFFDNFNAGILDTNDASLLFYEFRILNLILQNMCVWQRIIGCPSCTYMREIKMCGMVYDEGTQNLNSSQL